MPVYGRSRAITIATIEPRLMAIFFILIPCLVANERLQDGRQWVRHAPRLAVATCLVLVCVALVWGCVRSWRIALRIDQDQVTVRNFFRTHRVSLAQVSCFADGSALGGQSAHWWALCVVLRDGTAITARGTARSGRPSPKTLAKITEAAERYQIPAELTGAVLSRGLYADPGGQRGARYWSGRDWSPLLPADLADGKPLPVFPAPVSLPLREPYGSWQYAASQAKRFTVRAAVYAVAAVLLLAGALIVDLWDHGKLHQHVGLAGWLVLAGLCAFGGLSAWHQRKRYRRLDQAARGAPVAARYPASWVRQVGWALVPIVSSRSWRGRRFWSSRSSADGPGTGLCLPPTWSRWWRR
jgi:hypothetical protein